MLAPDPANRFHNQHPPRAGPATPDIEPVKSPAEPMVRGLSAGGKRIRTASPSRERVGLSGGNERCRRGEKGSLVSVSFLVRGTGGSNLVPSSGESDELPPARRGPRRISGCPLLGSRGDREDQAQRPDKTVGAKLGRDKNGG